MTPEGPDIRVKRVYEPAGAGDGQRVLVDRLWPRGLSRERAAVDHWMKELAPSNELRRWFNHEPGRWPAFLRRYAEELDSCPEPVERLRALCEAGPVTLVFAARDERRNNAVALRDYLLGEDG